MRVHKIFPDEFPEPWASDWGEDEYGLFMGFTYKGVRQLFRWIDPGTFLMGSPEGEWETQHKVTLTCYPPTSGVIQSTYPRLERTFCLE